MKINNVLSLFDGMSCGQIALNRSGIEYGNYYASEIDKYAITVTQANYPDTIQLGDVTKWREWDIDWSKIDLLMGGSPCQGFSFAGRRLAFDDPRSMLFFVFVDILNHIKEQNPNVKFLLENVRMKKEHEDVITKHMGVNPITINSALLSAQSRIRLYWTNIGLETCKFFGVERSTIKQPDDKGILLKDILQDEVDKKYFISDKMINRIKRSNNGERCFTTADKALCLAAGYYKQGRDNQYIVASRGRNPENPKSRESGLNTVQMLEPRYDGKTNCLTSVQKDNLVCSNDLLNPKFKLNTPTNINADKHPCLLANAGGKTRGIGIVIPNDNRLREISPYQGDKLHYEDEKMQCLSAQGGNKLRGAGYTDGMSIRRLTPTECERLQTVPDNYTNHVSDTQRYKMLGNGWTVDVICHILNEYDNGCDYFMEIKQNK